MTLPHPRLLLPLIVAVGFGVRFERLGTMPAGFFADEAALKTGVRTLANLAIDYMMAGH